MNQDTLIQLVTAAQAGDQEALEQLLLHAYAPVSFLCRKLLREQTEAQEQTLEILQAISQNLGTLPGPELYEKWVLRLAATRCVQIQQERTGEETEEAEEKAPASEEPLPIAGKKLDEEQTVETVQQLMQRLPEKPRTCMILLCCCDMSSNAISQLTGYPVEEVKEHMAEAQSFVLEQLQKYQEQDTEFYPITSLTQILQSGMFTAREEDAYPAVYRVLGKKLPDPNRGKKRLLLVLIVLLVIFNLVLGVLSLIVKNQNTYSPHDYAVTHSVTPAADAQG